MYVTIGAFSFQALERDHEKIMCADAEDEFRDFVGNLTPIVNKNDTYEVTSQELLDLIRKVEQFAGDGISVADYKTEGCPDLWTFSG